jgi:hypothetical protein
MGDEAESAHSLLRAIDDFRSEFLHWIDTELAQRQELGSSEDLEEGIPTPPRSVRSGRRGGSRRASWPERDGMNPVEGDFPSGMGRENHPNPVGHTDRDREAQMVRVPVVPSGPGTDREPEAPSLNPRERLDALARLLDQRLRQVEGAGPDRGATGGQSGKSRDQSVGHSDGWGVERASDPD